MSDQLYLLTINGNFALPTIEETRTLHNKTAGAPQNIAAARSLGDLSHTVYAPVNNDKNELFIMDVWNSMEGLNQFFANPQVQEQAGQIFTMRDPVVWVSAPDAFRFNFMAPAGKTDRVIGVVRGVVSSREQARKIMDKASSQGLSKARPLGILSHELYYRLTPPGTDSLEILGVDVWYNLEGAIQYYGAHDFEEQFHDMYSAAPLSWILQQPAGQWVEW
jgi:hypothetical protein